MEVFIPFMLFLLQPAGPEATEAELIRHPALYESEEDCLAAAEELKKRMIQATGSAPQSFCIAMPDPSEFDVLFRSMQERRNEARDSRN